MRVKLVFDTGWRGASEPTDCDTGRQHASGRRGSPAPVCSLPLPSLTTSEGDRGPPQGGTEHLPSRSTPFGILHQNRWHPGAGRLRPISKCSAIGADVVTRRLDDSGFRIGEKCRHDLLQIAGRRLIPRHGSTARLPEVIRTFVVPSTSGPCRLEHRRDAFCRPIQRDLRSDAALRRSIYARSFDLNAPPRPVPIRTIGRVPDQRPSERSDASALFDDPVEFTHPREEGVDHRTNPLKPWRANR